MYTQRSTSWNPPVWEDYTRIYNDPANRKYRYLQEDASVEELKAVYEDNPRRHLYGIFRGAVGEVQDPTLIGVVELKCQGPGTTGLFVAIDSHHHNCGYATEGIRDVLKKEGSDHPYIQLTGWRDNLAMKRVAQKCSFMLLAMTILVDECASATNPQPSWMSIWIPDHKEERWT